MTSLKKQSKKFEDVFRKDVAFTDQYTMKKKLGIGANGSVYKCTKFDGKKGKLYAVKVLIKGGNLPEHIKKGMKMNKKRYDEVFVQPLKKEAAMLLKVSKMEKKDDSFLKIVDAIEDDDQLYIVTEFCKGTSLAPLLKQQVSEDVVRDIVGQVCNTMAFLNTHGIAHRDLKPDNIMWDEKKKQIKIIDFGCARETKFKDMTTFSGTQEYMAPEIIKKKEGYSSNCDVWSLGVIAFQLLTGKQPFAGGSNLNLLMESILNDTPTFQLVESKLARSFLKKCLEKDPDKRVTFKALLGHKWFETQMKSATAPVKVKKSKMKNKNGSKVSSNVVEVQNELTSMHNDKMPKTVIDLNLLLQNRDLSQDEIRQLVDLACQHDGFGSKQFQKLCAENFKNCPFYTGVNYPEATKLSKEVTKAIKKLENMNKKKRPQTKVDLNNFLIDNKITELCDKRQLIDEVCKSGFEEDPNFLKVAKGSKKCSFYTGNMI